MVTATEPSQQAARKSETRANWIFLALFMLVMAPGLTVLTMKAYKKGAAGMNPPAPQSVSAYNNPNPQDPSLPRLVPPITAGFVEAIAQRLGQLQPELIRVARVGGSNPAMSEKRLLELVSSGRSEDATYLGLIGWDRTFAPLPSLYRFTVEREGTEVPATLMAYEQLNLPIEARSELQQYGYTLPPDSVLWMILKIQGTGPTDRLKMHYAIDGKSVEDALSIAPPATVSLKQP